MSDIFDLLLRYVTFGGDTSSYNKLVRVLVLLICIRMLLVGVDMYTYVFISDHI